MVANEETKVFRISMEDVQEGLRKEDEKELVRMIATNTMHYIEMFTDIVDAKMPSRNK